MAKIGSKEKVIPRKNVNRVTEDPMTGSVEKVIPQENQTQMVEDRQQEIDLKDQHKNREIRGNNYG